MGGRLYSQHFTDSYQVMSGEQRLKMTNNGEPVAETDIRASYLTIFLSLHGIQLPDGDPYELLGLGSEHQKAGQNAAPVVANPSVLPCNAGKPSRK